MKLLLKSFSDSRDTVLAYGGFLVLTLVFWGTYVLERGIHSDVYYIILSQTRPWWAGFIYPHDQSRPLMSLLYHVAYLLSNGSYLSLHIVYGLTVFLTGVLTFHLVRVVTESKNQLLAFMAGAIAIVHGGDAAVGLVGIIVVKQSVIGVLVASICIVGYCRTKRRVFIPLIFLGQALSLWTYEAGFPLLATAGVLMMYWYRRGAQFKAVWVPLAVWLTIPMVFIGQLVWRYVLLHKASYQSQELVLPVSLDEIVARAFLYLKYGVGFWTWPSIWFPQIADCIDSAVALLWQPILLGTAISVLLFLLIGMSLDAKQAIVRKSVLFWAATFLFVSYSPWFFISNGGGNWRTEFFAAPSAAFLLACGVLALARLPFGKYLGLIIFSIIVSCGLFAGLVSQLYHTKRWLEYTSLLEGIVLSAPQIRNDSVVVLLNVPTGSPDRTCKNAPLGDPFQDYWYMRTGIEVLYPGRKLEGFYLRSDGSQPPSSGLERLDLESNGLLLTNIKTGTTRIVPYDRTLLFEYVEGRGTKLLTEFEVNHRQVEGYLPSKLIVQVKVPDETLNRLSASAPHLP